MADKPKNKKRSDLDVLRARDIIPPFNVKKSKLDYRVSREEKEALAGPNPIPIETANSPVPTARFDLAQDIMSGHRKIVARKRTGPGAKTKPQIEPLHARPMVRAIEQPVSTFSGRGKIIAEIVARDIERLCRQIIQDG